MMSFFKRCLKDFKDIYKKGELDSGEVNLEKKENVEKMMVAETVQKFVQKLEEIGKEKID